MPTNCYLSKFSTHCVTYRKILQNQVVKSYIKFRQVSLNFQNCHFLQVSNMANQAITHCVHRKLSAGQAVRPVSTFGSDCHATEFSHTQHWRCRYRRQPIHVICRTRPIGCSSPLAQTVQSAKILTAQHAKSSRRESGVNNAHSARATSANVGCPGKVFLGNRTDHHVRGMHSEFPLPQHNGEIEREHAGPCLDQGNGAGAHQPLNKRAHRSWSGRPSARVIESWT